MNYVEYVIGVNSGDEDIKQEKKTNAEYTTDNILGGICKTFGIAFGNQVTGSFGFDGANFGSASAGELQPPPGFFSDNILFNFVYNAEGNVAVKWVDSSGNLCTSCGIDGYDYPPGFHDKSFLSAMRKVGVNPQDLGVRFTNRGRKAMEGELKEGAVYGYYSTPVPSSAPYWKKIIPIYRDRMIDAWNHGASTIQNPAERLAIMHTMRWAFGNASMQHAINYVTKGGGNGTWPHRLQMAQKAVSMA